MVAGVTASGGFSAGSKTFVIGTKYFEEEWAQFECWVEICLDTMTEFETGCRKKKGTEYWIVVSGEKIRRTVKGDVDIKDGRGL